MRKKTDRDALFQSIRGAAEITGLSTRYIRDGCRNGTIPHIRAGSDYRINMALFLEDLNKQSRPGGTSSETAKDGKGLGGSYSLPSNYHDSPGFASKIYEERSHK